jgi:hypothetical protein
VLTASSLLWIAAHTSLEIDLKKLIADNPSCEGWYSISQAAEERRMFLLAYEAYDMNLTYADSETMPEAEQVGSQNELDRWVLKGMRD